MKKLFVICIFLTIVSHSVAQRVAPGVPPQHYVSIRCFRILAKTYTRFFNKSCHLLNLAYVSIFVISIFKEQPPAYQQQYQPPPPSYQQHGVPPSVNPQQYQQVPVQNVDQQQYGNVVQQQQQVILSNILSFLLTFTIYRLLFNIIRHSSPRGIITNSHNNKQEDITMDIHSKFYIQETYKWRKSEETSEVQLSERL